MTHYETSTPRTACAFLAIALTAVTLGLTVVAPAHVHESAARGEAIVADAPTRVERIDVIAVRSSKVAAMHAGTALCKQQET